MGLIFGIGFDRSYSGYCFYKSVTHETCDECEEPGHFTVGLRLGWFYIYAGVER